MTPSQFGGVLPTPFGTSFIAGRDLSSPPMYLTNFPIWTTNIMVPAGYTNLQVTWWFATSATDYETNDRIRVQGHTQSETNGLFAWSNTIGIVGGIDPNVDNLHEGQTAAGQATMTNFTGFVFDLSHLDGTTNLAVGIEVEEFTFSTENVSIGQVVVEGTPSPPPPPPPAKRLTPWRIGDTIIRIVEQQ